VVAIDAAPGILAETKATCAGAGVTNVEFHEADAEALPYDDGSFDVVHAHQVLQHVQHPVRVLEEMRRVCRPGGVVAARDGDYATWTWWPKEPAMDRWLELYSSVARRNGGEPDAGRRLLAWAREAGYSKVDAGASVWCAATPADRHWWADLWAERVTSTALGDRAVEFGLATRPELEEIAAGWRHWAEAPDGWLAIVHGEILCEA
jgi:SAM-dependent methyltransferase